MTKKKNENVETPLKVKSINGENVEQNVEKTKKLSESEKTTDPADVRVDFVEQFNKDYSEYAELIDETKCSQEYQDECKKDFEDLIKDFNGESFEIAEKENALETAKFLKEWNEKCVHWEHESWKGVILFDEVISKAIEDIEKGDKDNLYVDYGALVYLYGSMNQVQGVGLESAKLMQVLETDNRSEEEKKEDKVEPVTFSNILNNLSKQIERIKLIDAKMNVYQTRWSMACNGFKMNLKIKDLEEFGKLYSLWKNDTDKEKN